jgi:hypothetical protein
MPRSPLALVPLLPVLLSLTCVTWSGCNDCDFTEIRCSGNAVEQCGGVDQQIGRTVQRTACEGVNPVCVQATERLAFCAGSSEKRCTPGERRCEGDKLIECREGFEVGTDCLQVREAAPGAMPGLYRCTAPPGGSADCRKPIS